MVAAADQLAAHGLAGVAGRGQAADRLRPQRPRGAAHRQGRIRRARAGGSLPVPMVETYLDLARGGRLPGGIAALGAGASRRRSAAWASGSGGNLGLRRDGRVIALNSSGAYGAAKHWPAEHCAALARLIVEQLDHDVLVLCGPRRMPAGPRHRPAGRSSPASSRWPASRWAWPRPRAAWSGAGCWFPPTAARGTWPPPWASRSSRCWDPRCRCGSRTPRSRGAMVRLELDCIGCGKRTCPLRHHRCMQGPFARAGVGRSGRPAGKTSGERHESERLRL